MPPRISTDPVTWLSAEDVAVDFTLPPGTAPAGRQALATARLVIFVGLTGSGKSATVTALAETGAVRAVLPDRRAVTDRIILPAMTGNPDRPVTDRIERFRLTAAFRDAHPGGMGDVLERLTVDRDAAEGWLAGGWLVFDGVRGPAEAAAAARLPNAVFAVLEAPPEVRVARLSLRGDPFDRASLDGNDMTEDPGGAADYLRALREHEVGTLMQEETMLRLARLLSDAGADPAAVASAAAIVVEESRYYDTGPAIAVLQDRAPGRTVIVDTAENPVADVVSAISARLMDAG
ncbi:AAA family ATPase [Thalassobaculum litoreum]|uniref:AAA domain n=1 Tax=Thalassobaculum litoreum DSM 18839 TaxID=1123362 RepID=A0A8G2BI64_9PROT|nr:AAA family ATPase [Thalassobaculum litoreum]SDF44944.1 AAA domain [Thalassobaculum litoreum DSM 18839]